MNVDEWKHVVVLGAAGKMGRGIALLLLQHIALIDGATLTLLDTNPEGFNSLKNYLKEHLLKYAERNINALRRHYLSRNELVDNGEMIQAFLNEGLDKVKFVTSLEECRSATLIFEAILEEVKAKVQVFSHLKKIAHPKALYFSNTSSIPIRVLEQESQLNGCLIGFHFYNPPAIQKLVEIVIPHYTKEYVKKMAVEIAHHLNKTLVFSNDIAGFIGNGHFIREVVEACNSVQRLSKKMPFSHAICKINTITQSYLMRPMGLFQLVDYVGIDVVDHIATTMTHFLEGQNFSLSLIKEMIACGIKGGQNGEGNQNPGFFSYEKGKPIEVYDLQKQSYIPYIFSEETNQFFKKDENWKDLSKDKNRPQKLSQYFRRLLDDQSSEAEWARYFLENSRKISEDLVKDGVAKSLNDVNTVLCEGFFHLYDVEYPWKGSKQ